MAEIDRPRSQLDHEANFCPASDRAVQRDLFPLPIPTVGSSRLKSELSRKSQQRLGKALNKEAMVQQCVIALNDLYAGGVSSPFFFMIVLQPHRKPFSVMSEIQCNAWALLQRV